jgi:MSHA pilin protein MshA
MDAARLTTRPAGLRLARRMRGAVLLEPIVMTALLGTLAAAALPGLVDASSQAQTAALRGVAAAATSAMVVNQGMCLVTAQARADGRCLAIESCADVAALFVGGLPEGYRVEGAAPAGARNGFEFGCSLTQVFDGQRATFRGIVSGR